MVTAWHCHPPLHINSKDISWFFPLACLCCSGSKYGVGYSVVESIESPIRRKLELFWNDGWIGVIDRSVSECQELSLLAPHVGARRLC